MQNALSVYRATARFTFYIIMVAVLAGCAGKVNVLPRLSEQIQLLPNQGIVVVRVINASAHPLPFNQLTITPENLNESKRIKPERLLAPYSHIDSSTVFSSPVAAGNYALSSVSAFYSKGEYSYSRSVAANASFGTFTVNPG